MYRMNVYKHAQLGETGVHGKPFEAFAFWRESNTGMQEEWQPRATHIRKFKFAVYSD